LEAQRCNGSINGSFSRERDMMKLAETFRRRGSARHWYGFWFVGILLTLPLVIARADLTHVDSDGDGLPDDWEIAHFTDLSQDFADDADGDGYTNIQEYNGGSSPASADSMPGFARSPWPMPGHDPLNTGCSQHTGPHILTQETVIPFAGEIDIVLGPDGNIWIPADDAIKVYTPAGEEIVEHRADGEISVSPTFIRDGSFCFAYKGDEKGLQCIGGDGNPRWHQPLSVPVEESRIVVDSAQNVYLSFDREVKAYSIERGYLVWRRSHGSWGEHTPPITLDGEGNIYVDGGQSGLGAFWPLGDLKWTFSADWVRGAPAAGIDGKLYFCWHSRLAAVSRDTGLSQWQFDPGTPFSLSGLSIARDGTIVACSRDGSVYALHPNGQLQWSYATGGELKAAPAIGSDGTVYVGSTDTFVYAIDPTGKLLSRFPTGDQIVTQPVIDAAGRLIVSSSDGNTYVLVQSPVLPGQVVYIAPQDEASSVPLDSVLEWNPADLASSYDVYLGEDPDPPYVENTPDTFWHPASLEPDRFYYWRVDSRNESGVTRGPVWRFSTPDDADGDGMDDRWEIHFFGSIEADGSGDSDSDGLSNLDEFLSRADPTKQDTDGDGLSDGEEVSVHGTLPTRADTDQDGLSDREEIVNRGTDPLDADSDDDGFADGEEAEAGADPKDSLSRPPALFVNGKTGNDGWDGTEPVHTIGNKGPKRTIQAAIDAATFFNRINVAPGSYRENILINGTMTLASWGSATTIIRGRGDDSVVTVQGRVSPTLEGFTITGGAGKVAGEHRNGGGLHIVGSSLKIEDCIIEGNYLDPTGSGGGIYCKNGSLTISNSLIRDNRAPHYMGGGVYCEGSSLTMIACEVNHNEAVHGAGIYCAESKNTEITNSFIVRNITNGIVIGGEGSSATIMNCTIAHNAWSRDEREIQLDMVHPPNPFLLANNIVWGQGDDLYDVEPWEGAVVSHCNIEDGDFLGESGNISTDPLFLDPDHYNYRLQPGSPCIDSGTSEEAPLEDFEGDFRVFPDMGADEFADADGDGMQDEWERVNDLDPRDPADRNADPDLDGRSNFEEFRRRTLPHDEKSGIKYVDAKYVGTEEGTAAHPFRTIQRAIDAASAGETIIVRPGTYYEQVEMIDGIELAGSGAALTIVDGNKSMAPLITLRNVSSCTLSGFTIRNSRGDAPAIDSMSSAPLIRDCVISNCHNTASVSHGGGLRAYGTRGHPTIPTLINCIFEDCSSRWGAAIYGGANLFGTTIRRCRAVTTIIECGGGGTFDGCLISENVSSGGDYGNVIIRISDGSFFIENTRITFNVGEWARCWDGSVTFTNCVIAHNVGSGHISACDSAFTNCTIVANLGGPSREEGSRYAASLLNCILWGNGDDLTGFTSDQVRYCSIGDGDFEGVNGNISTDPAFVNQRYANYRISAVSPCRDAGSAEGAPEFDFEGDERSLPDIGADEFLDSDFDGIQDAWEAFYGLNPDDNSDSSADPDGDGKSNYAEWLRGTDPTDDKSPRDVVYVDAANRSGIEDGSPKHPYATIQRGIDTAWPGDTVLVSDGTYDGSLRMKQAVTLVGEEPEITTITSGGDVACISCYGITDGTISGFILRGGRGVLCRFASPSISECAFLSNVADGGAALLCEDRSNPVISRCLFEQSEGTAIHCRDSSPLIRDCVLRRNRATGIFCAKNAAPVIANCFIVQNGGSGVACDGTSSPQLLNCTVARNRGGKGIAVSAGGMPRVLNTILWENTESDVEGLTEQMISFSVIGSGEFVGVNGNISEDPRFWGMDYLNYRLMEDSPCIGAGSGEGGTTSDFEGDERSTPDIGADEFMDTDGDGMQDAWERSYMLNPDDGSDALADPDGDEVTNFEEYVLTSNPRNGLIPRGVVYVQAGAPATGADGTLEHPFLTIQEGIDAAWYGDLVSVGEGKYSGRIHLKQSVAVVGQGPDVVEVQIKSGPSVVEASLLENVRLEGFSLTNLSGPVVFCEYSSLDLVRCDIVNSLVNSSTEGAVNYQRWSDGSVVDCTISKNELGSRSAISISESSVEVRRCWVEGNLAEWGGGISGYRSTVVLVNNVIAQNSAERNGGGITTNNCSLTATNCTVVGNSAGDRGGGIYVLDEPYPLLFNTIIAGNSDDLYGVPQESVSHCHIGDGDFEGINGNTSGDPLFVLGTYYLTPSSPCVDGGNNSALHLPATDIEGNQRIINGGTGDIVDMGALEYDPARPLVLVQTPAGGTVEYVEVIFTLYDSQGDPCDIVAEYSQEDGGWLPATCADGEAGTTHLLSSPLGFLHTFRWDPVADVGLVQSATVRVRITPSDPGKGVSGESGEFEIIIDSDRDGLPDAWEKRIVDHSPDDPIDAIQSVFPYQDFDGDGYSNHTEYVSGTDPTSPESYFGVMAVHRASAPGEQDFVWITWPASGDKAYDIFWSSDDFGSGMTWHQVSPVRPEDLTDEGDGRMTWVDRGTSDGMQGKPPGSVRKRFYRILVTPNERP